MKREIFDTLKMGARVKVPRGRELPPTRGILVDKVKETALIRIGCTPGWKPILQWAHYTKLEKEI